MNNSNKGRGYAVAIAATVEKYDEEVMRMRQELAKKFALNFLLMCTVIMENEPGRFDRGILASVQHSNDPDEPSYICLMDSIGEPLDEHESKTTYSATAEISGAAYLFFEMIGVDHHDSVTVNGKYVIPFGVASVQDIREI